MSHPAFDSLWDSIPADAPASPASPGPKPKAAPKPAKPARVDPLDAVWDAAPSTPATPLADPGNVTPHGASGTFGQSPSIIDGLGNAVGSGLTAGFRDELNAKVRSMEGDDYQTALTDERAKDAAFHQAHPVLDVVGKTAGAMGSLAALPAMSPVVAGALYGAASGAGDATAGHRVGGAVFGGAAGAVGGKVIDAGLAGARALMTPTTSAQMIEAQAARAASAARLYAAAIKEGQGTTATPTIQRFLNEPDIAEIVSGLKETRQFQNVPADDPTMLDAVYKTLSDRAAQVKKGLEAANPSKPNIGRFRGQDIKAAQSQALDAMSGPTGNGPMPSYKTAVLDYAKRSSDMDALLKGNRVLAAKVNGSSIPATKQALRATPEAFEQTINDGATPSEAQSAVQGILGATKYGLTTAPLTAGRKAIMAAPNLIRSTEPVSGDMQSLLARLGLVGAMNNFDPSSSP